MSALWGMIMTAQGAIIARARHVGRVQQELCLDAAEGAVMSRHECIALDGRGHDITCGQIDIGNAATAMTEPMAAGVPQASGALLVEPRIEEAV